MSPLDLINEFNQIRDMAELKAYSKISQERPLSTEELAKMKKLATKIMGDIPL